MSRGYSSRMAICAEEGHDLGPSIDLAIVGYVSATDPARSSAYLTGDLRVQVCRRCKALISVEEP
jgi:hypothetical protein